MDSRDMPWYGEWGGWTRWGDQEAEINFPEKIKNEPDWQKSNRRPKPISVRRAKANRARAERKAKKRRNRK
jgi:hypothetical protein